MVATLGTLIAQLIKVFPAHQVPTLAEHGTILEDVKANRTLTVQDAVVTCIQIPNHARIHSLQRVLSPCHCLSQNKFSRDLTLVSKNFTETLFHQHQDVLPTSEIIMSSELAKGSERRAINYIYMTLICLTFGLTFLFRTSLRIITDAIEAEYHVTSTGVGMLSSSYYLAYLLSQQPWGLYLQLFTCESALLIANLSLCVLSLSFPFSPPSIWSASVIFFFAGIATGCTYPIAMIFGGQRFGSNSVSFCGGLALITAMLHSFVGGVIQAQIYDDYGLWQPLYFGIAVLAFAYAVLTLICLCVEVSLSFPI